MRRRILFIMAMILITSIMTTAALAKTTDKERELHFRAWQDVAEKAASMPKYKYALYASRSLAVKHPELYLQGDAIFNKLLVSLPNMALFYTTRHEDLAVMATTLKDNFRSLPQLPKHQYDWGGFDLSAHHEVSSAELYRNASLFPFLDLRLPLLGVSLLGWDYQATPLAMAQMLYFQLTADRSNRAAYLLVSEEGTAYVAVFDRARNIRALDHRGVVAQPREKIVLIFNEKRVWYPLMERDDAKRDANLRRLVAEYAPQDPLPRLTKQEEQLVQILRETTGMGKRQDQQWMLITASRLHSRAWQRLGEIQKLYPQWSHVSSSHAPELFTQELALIYRLSNRLSPSASHLAAQATLTYADLRNSPYHERLDYTLKSLSQQYNHYMGVASAMYPWWHDSELHFLNIDDAVFSKRANCIMIATNLAGILDLAQLPELETYQAFIPEHVLLLLTGADGYYAILDNNRFLAANRNYIPSPLRSVGMAEGWIILQKHPQRFSLKDIYTSYEPEVAEHFIRTTLKDFTELNPDHPMFIAVFRDQDYRFDSQTYGAFLNTIDKGTVKIKQWK